MCDFGLGAFAATVMIIGWNAGLSNYWRCLLTIPLATMFSVWVYANFCAWFQQNSWLPSDSAIFVGFIIVWFFLSISLDTFMDLLLPERLHKNLRFWDKSAGCLIAAFKVTLVLLIAAVVSEHNESFNEPPRLLWLPRLVSDSYRQSAAVRTLQNCATMLPPAAIRHLVAQRTPQFQAEFAEEQDTGDSAAQRKVRQLIRQTHELLKDVGE